MDFKKAQEKARKAAEEAPARFRALHDARFTDCGVWGRWTEHTRLAEGGAADCTFVGCQEHGVAVQVG